MLLWGLNKFQSKHHLNQSTKKNEFEQARVLRDNFPESCTNFQHVWGGCKFARQLASNSSFQGTFLGRRGGQSRSCSNLSCSYGSYISLFLFNLESFPHPWLPFLAGNTCKRSKRLQDFMYFIVSLCFLSIIQKC